MSSKYVAWVGSFGIVLHIATGAALPAAALANFSRSYSAVEPITSGSIVSLTENGTDQVAASDTASANRVVGVVAASGDSLLAADVKEDRVQVVVSGTVHVIVSTIAGDIKNGSQIAVSPLRGIGMRSEPGARVIGVAQAAFSATSASAQTRTITDKDGKQTDVAIGIIPIALSVGYAPESPAGTTWLMSGVVDAVKVVVGHEVEPWRVMTAAGIALMGLMALVALVFGAVRGSLISIGRNPMAKNSIYISLAQVMAMTFGLVVVVMLALYFVLR